MILQAVVFYYTIVLGGTMHAIEENAYSMLHQRVQSQRNALENDLNSKWPILLDAVNIIGDEMDKVSSDGAAQVLQDEGLAAQFISNSMDDIISLLRRTSVSEAYIILDDPQQTENGLGYSGLYITNPDPTSYSADNSDLTIKRGASSLFEQSGIPSDVYWHPMIVMNDSSIAILDKPISAAKSNPSLDFNAFGYWHKMRSPDDNTKIVHYSLPLIDQNGYVYGVIGIGMNERYLTKILNYRDLDIKGGGVLSLAVTNDNGTTFAPAIISSSASMQSTANKAEFTLSPIANRINVSEMTVDEKNIIADVQYLDIYPPSSPFVLEQWAVLGFVSEELLMVLAHSIRHTVLIVSLVCLSMAIAVAVIIFRKLVYPIDNIIYKLRDSDPARPVELGKAGFSEIDELSSAIEAMSSQLYENSSLLSRIINVADVKIAAFEVDKQMDVLKYTDRFFQLLGLPEPNCINNQMRGADFVTVFEQCDFETEQDVQNGWILKVVDERSMVRWVRFTMIDDDKKMLGVVADVTSEMLTQRRIEYERDYDLLTNLINRRAFLSSLDKLFEFPHRLENAVMIMIDLDNLKYINDSYGHDCGDGYLQATANTLKRIPVHNMLVARMSGDEFFVFIYGYSDRELLHSIVSQVKDTIDSSYYTLPSGEQMKIRCSAGVSWYPYDGDSIELLLRHSDFAMYSAKNTKKGELCEFDPQSYQQNAYLLHSREELNKLIDGRLVDYYFQPIVDTSTGEIFAYEALMRSRIDSLRGPLEILSLAKSQSKLYEIERVTWFTALEQAVQKERFADGGCHLFINSVSNHSLSDEDIALLAKTYGHVLSRVVLEVTESEKLVEDITCKKRDFLASFGGKIALDDFGTGYNSDTALLILNPDYVKIDISIVRNIDIDTSRQGIFGNLISYSHQHGIKVIAEGVETMAEMTTLINMGADYLQGYYIAMPLPEMEDIDPAVVDKIVAIAKGTSPEPDEGIKIWQKKLKL